MFKKLLIVTITCLTSLCYGGQYNSVDLGVMSFTNSVPQSINDQGDVIGFAWNGKTRYAFLWTEEAGLRIIDKPGNPFVRNINNKGQVGGQLYVLEKGWFSSEWKIHAHIWNDVDSFVDIGTINGNDTYVIHVDDNGNLLLEQKGNVFFWENGKVTKIDGATNFIYVKDLQIHNVVMNNKKQVAVIKKEANIVQNLLINLETQEAKPFLTGYVGTPYVTAINDLGDVAGFTIHQDNPEGYIVKADGTTIRIPNFEIYGINDQGVAVGRILKDNLYYGAIYLNGTLFDVNELVVQQEGQVWNRIFCIEKINSSGELIAYIGVYDNVHAIKLTPVAE